MRRFSASWPPAGASQPGREMRSRRNE
jgi:hypothetical protein